MKFLYLLVSCFFIRLSSEAQLQQRQMLIGGSAAFQYQKNESWNAPTYKTNQLTISPQAGIFIVNKLAAGLNFSIDHYSSESFTPNETYKTNSLSYSPFARYYLLNEEKSFNVVAQVNYHYIHSVQKSSNGQKIREVERAVSVSAGPVIFLTPQIGLEFLVGYKQGRTPFGFGLEKIIFSSIGFQIHIKR